MTDADKLARYDDLANLVEELHDENIGLRTRYKDLDALICELRRQAAARNHTWPCVLLSDLIPLCDAHDLLRQQLATSQKGEIVEYVRYDPNVISLELRISALDQQLANSQQALRNVYELWVGVEGIVVWTDEEAHLLQLILQMRDAAKAGMK